MLQISVKSNFILNFKTFGFCKQFTLLAAARLNEEGIDEVQI